MLTDVCRANHWRGGRGGRGLYTGKRQPSATDPARKPIVTKAASMAGTGDGAPSLVATTVVKAPTSAQVT